MKDNRAVALRGPTEADTKAMLVYLKTIMAETPYLSAYPDEIDMDEAAEAGFLKRMAEDPRVLWLSAYEKGGTVAGNFDLHPIGNVDRYAHRAALGIGLVREYWGSGLAPALMERMLAGAHRLGYEQVELEVASENRRAIALYQKFGFEQTGTLPRFYKYRDGSYMNALYMVCRL